MARNKVQFQRGLSDVEFERLYGTEEKCRAALFSWRWPEGFACPACGGFAHCELEKRALWQCNACRAQTSLTAGTIFASTKLDLTVWFRAMFHMTQTKQGISALELSRRLDVSYNTAWAMHHKLRQVMLERDQGEPLDGRIEMDDAYLGGERSGGKRGRGSPGKTPIVAAVETTEDGKAHRVKLRRVRRFTKKNIKKITGRIVKRGAGRHRRARLLQWRRRRGLHARADRHRLRPQGRSSPCIQGRQHGARQHQERHRCHVPIREQEARPAPARRVRVPLQPPL